MLSPERWPPDRGTGATAGRQATPTATPARHPCAGVAAHMGLIYDACMTNTQTPTHPAIAHIRGTYADGVADYLLTSDGISLDRRRPSCTWRFWATILDDLVARGWMRVSRTGRYWWITRPRQTVTTGAVVWTVEG